ncbi:sodium:proton antiporter [Comamonas testosteroni]|uniref:Sodium:proton antiporter n=1 Tax=Comamonas testosteroni TaxID=285 RepID=A0A096HRU7_COMTE|nr:MULTISPECIES: Na+/H+ antiporter [Comamonas]KGH31682.1 sodium:proton antiporter [Comamonas testosteroni]KOC20728.1 sodium:proton antiporter [Comamonas testosteroni]KWT73709.1 Na+/H+ and K+/H+ antiporter [Comamonas testosteroni]MDN5506045.1 Na+/H+ antiporter [Comamonas sp.]MDN5536631.1 Na+/H+ antiporter [Comamonas sp.]
MHAVETVLLVLLLGALTGIVARYIRAIPLPLIQIALGALIAWPQAGLHIAFDPELFLLLFIPPLLFADGWRIPKREFFALAKPILLLALGLVLFTVLGLGYLIHWMIPEIPLTVAFALAAVISPTDAVAVSAITRNLGMPEKTMHVLEGESLLNDASGLVALKFAIAATLTGMFSWGEVAKEFTWMAVGGLGVGALIGWGFSHARGTITRRLGDVAATQMVLLLVLLPFAAYIVGEKIGVSGILAAVAAGIATNFADLERSSYISERLQTEGTWSMVEAAFNGAIFLLLGLQLPSIIGVPLHQAGHDWWILVGYVAAISFALLLMRWIWLVLGVHGSLLRAHRQGKMTERPSKLLNLATTLAGIRGAVTLAGALSVPMLLNNGQPFPGRDMLVFLATGTILFTLVIGAVGLPIVLRHLPPHEESPTVREERLAREQACMAAMAKLTLSEEEMQRRDPEWVAMRQEVNGHLTQEYRNRIQLLDDGSGAAQSIELLREAPEVVRQRKLRYVMEIETRIECIHAERDFYYAERQAHRINDESLRSLVSELDMQEIAMRKRLAVARRAAGLPMTSNHSNH